MKTRQIRELFCKFFQKHDHTIVPSSPVIPHDDPSLLFINAGMNQFKQVFLGATSLDYKRAVSSQKCIRVGGKHNDLDNVGHTSRHLTFFEMLGNFSFGDYFKEEAIAFAWDFTTNKLKLDGEKIWATVYEEDDEAFELWKKHLPEKRIVRLGMSSNYWTMGDTGPQGPCSELLFDRGAQFGKATSPKTDLEGERFFEFWNLVFMQFNKDEKGELSSLPNPCIDTGMGLERILSLLNHQNSVFATDVLHSLIQKTEVLAKTDYSTCPPAFHVIADHLRSLSFAIGDGCLPSNVDRGYVLRKILRRAVRYGRQIGLDKPFLHKLVPHLVHEMGDEYTELKTSQTKIEEVIALEEENFQKTLHRGGNILQNILLDAKESAKKQISGEDAFKLKDTYGFPLEEILLLAKDSGLEVNLESFALHEEKAKELSKKSRAKVAQTLSSDLFPKFLETHEISHFVGYDKLEANASILGLLVGNTWKEVVEAGEEVAIILDQTTFYPEMGGQVGDKGVIFHHNARFEVTSCKVPYPGIILHQGVVKEGAFLVGEPIHTQVERGPRLLTMRNHTATHLLHWALEKVLGSHIRQGGSLVDPDRLRFDFSHHKALSPEEIRSIECLIQEKIRENGSVHSEEVPYESVKQKKEIKQFFGEKYGKMVRLVSIEEFSKELCGGTHVESLNEIGLFRITKEVSVASGMRRIEAVTGKVAEAFMYEKEDLLASMATLLDAPEPKLKERLTALLEEQKEMKQEMKKLRQAHIHSLQAALLEKRQLVKEVPFIASEVDLYKEEFAPLAASLLHQLGSGILLLATKREGSVQLLLKISSDLVAKGFHAGTLIQKIAPLVGGSGGGKPDQAQAGGTNPENLDKAFLKAKELIQMA